MYCWLLLLFAVRYARCLLPAICYLLWLWPVLWLLCDLCHSFVACAYGWCAFIRASRFLLYLLFAVLLEPEPQTPVQHPVDRHGPRASPPPSPPPPPPARCTSASASACACTLRACAPVSRLGLSPSSSLHVLLSSHMIPISIQLPYDSHIYSAPI